MLAQNQSGSIPAIDLKNLPYQQQIKHLAEGWQAKYNLPGVWCAMIKDGRVQALVAVGKRNLERGLPAQVENHLNLGSFSKVVSGTLYAMFVGKGVISYSTTIADCFPELVAKYPQSLLLRATLSQLENHTSGLQDGNGAPFDGVPGNIYRFKTLEKAAADDRQKVPGAEYRYCNEGPVIAAAMIERLTRTNYESWLYGPMGKQLGISDPHQVNTDPDEVTPYFLSDSTLTLGKLGDNKKRAFAPQGACSLTLTDLCGFLLATMNNNAALPPKVFAAVTAVPPRFRASSAGWHSTIETPDILFHQGSTGRGEYFDAFVNVHKHSAFAFYTNCYPSNPGVLDGIRNDLHALSLKLR